jgi:hypothetical protein
MNNRDTRNHRLDTVNENAKFLVQCYGKEIAIKFCNDSIAIEEDNDQAQEFWLEVKKAVEKSD